MKIADVRKHLKISKYALAKKIGVSWNSVHLWEKELWKPNLKNQKKIEELMK